MNYELVKKLKDAGYPIKYTLGALAYDQEPPSQFIIDPTLSELIEACGDRFEKLEYNPYHDETVEDWYTTGCDDRKHKPGEYSGHTIWGKTPEEAVANLWLALTPSENPY